MVHRHNRHGLGGASSDYGGSARHREATLLQRQARDLPGGAGRGRQGSNYRQGPHGAKRTQYR